MTADCRIDSIHFDVKSENKPEKYYPLRNCTKEMRLFVKTLFFIIENKIR